MYAILIVERRGVGRDLPCNQGFEVTVEVRQPFRLDQRVGNVDPESVDTAIEPEAQHVEEHLADLEVVPVQVGLPAVEHVQVPLAVRHLSPGRPAKVRRPIVRQPLGIDEPVAGALRRAWSCGQRLLEPGMLVAGVIGHDVDEDPQAEVVRGGDQRVGVLQDPKTGSTSW